MVIDCNTFEYNDSYEDEDSFTIEDFRKKWEERILDNGELSTAESGNGSNDEYEILTDDDCKSESSYISGSSKANVLASPDEVSFSKDSANEKAVVSQIDDIIIPAVPGKYSGILKTKGKRRAHKIVEFGSAEISGLRESQKFLQI